MCIKKCAVCYDKGAVAGDKGRFSIYKGVRRILTNEFTFLWETVRAGGRQKSASIWCSNSVYLYFNETVFAYLYFNKTVFAYMYFNTALLVYLDLGWNIYNIAQDIAQSSNHKSNLAHMTLYQALKRTFQFLNLKIRPEKRMASIYWQ